jgi:DNA-binding PadR family transcriptional regulator
MPPLDLERDGFLTSNWSEDTFPERGNRPRRYYHQTDKARTALAATP